jgi:putative ABC transport system permease protein
VSRGFRLRPLDRKLLRDLLEMKGQALAIALVIAAGVAMFAMYLSNFDSLRRTQHAYYERQRFADVFASLKRAPQSLEQRIAAIPGVAALDTRVVADVTLDIAGIAEPARGRLISIPAAGRPRLDDVYLREGRWIEPGHPEEVLASEAFVRARHLSLGDTVAAVLNGHRVLLRVVGVALSPEYVYTMPPGEMTPDDSRYGIFWMERRALAAAFDMQDGLNDVALQVSRSASADAVIARLDRLLAPYGGQGAVPRALQPSNWALDSELQQLENFGLVIPVIFLTVAAFLLNMAMARALAVQRPQIAALKALGYANREIAWHYTKWALVIASLGAALGTGAGAWLGAGMIHLYNQYFRFPFLDYHLSGGITAGAVALSLAAAALGALFAVRAAVRVPPAEAMRPEPPARYRTSLVERAGLRWRLTHVSRMVLRNLERQPGRAAASVLGISAATAILAVGFFFVDATQELMRVQFSVVQRQDVTVSFVEPASAGALDELRGLPAVLALEPMRSVPARIRFEHRFRSLAITGLVPRPDLNRIVERRGAAIDLPPEGLVLSRVLARVLGVKPGDSVTLEILEGARPVSQVSVARLADDYVGVSAYMALDALHRLLHEGATLSGAHLQVDPANCDVLYRRLKLTPRVAGVSITEAARASFERTMAESMALMTAMNLLFAGIIAFGVVYNAARISLSERSRELASLRVLGFTIAEVSLILLGELAVLTFAGIPPGLALGYGLGRLIVASVESELYRFPLVVTPQALAWTALAVLAAATVSGLVVRRRLDRLDLVSVLKQRE